MTHDTPCTYNRSAYKPYKSLHCIKLPQTVSIIMHTNTARFLHLQQKTLVTFALWPKADGGMLYKIWKSFIMIFQYAFHIFNCVYMISVWGDIEAMSQTSYFLLTHTTMCCKMTTFIYNHLNVQKILDFMDSEMFAPKNPAQEKWVTCSIIMIFIFRKFFEVKTFWTHINAFWNQSLFYSKWFH